METISLFFKLLSAVLGFISSLWWLWLVLSVVFFLLFIVLGKSDKASLYTPSVLVLLFFIISVALLFFSLLYLSKLARIIAVVITVLVAIWVFMEAKREFPAPKT
jgi:peptidoglycan/LPS O-acetylase OafA/YrhL